MLYSPLSTSIEQDIEDILQRNNNLSESPHTPRQDTLPSAVSSSTNDRLPLFNSSYDTPRPRAHTRYRRNRLKYFSLSRWLQLRTNENTDDDPNLDASQKLLAAATIRGDTKKCSAQSFAEYEGCMRCVEGCATQMGQETDYMMTPYGIGFLVHYICESALSLRLIPFSLFLSTYWSSSC